MEKECPDHIGKYRNIRYLDEGGMGAVYLAKDPILKNDVVIKQLKFGRAGTKARDRFKREILFMNKLTSEHIVRSFEFIEEADERTGRKKDYFVLEYVDGMSLDRLLEKDGILPLPVVMLIFRDTCLGLYVAHRNGVIHRDIKPANILISRAPVVKLADFGIAATEHGDDEDRGDARAGRAVYGGDLTAAGSTMGTLSYMAPEQMKDASSVTKRADIYAMGITLYEMIYGEKPYTNKKTLAAQFKMLEKNRCINPPRTNSKGERIPFKIRRMIRKMTMFSEKRRYRDLSKIIKISSGYINKFDMQEVKGHLRTSLTVYSKRHYGAYPAFQGKNRTKKIIAAAVLLALLAFGLFRFAWNEGVFHRTILRHWYTPVTISLNMPETKSVKADLPARVFFYYNDNDSIPDVPGSQRDFAADRKQGEGGGDKTVSIKPVYLRHGDYRMKIAAGPSVWWKDLRVDHDAVNLELDYLQAEKRTIRISATAVDDETGEDISDICSCMIQTASGLENLRSINPSSLKTGEVYKIYIRAKGYQDEYFSLMIDWYQDELFINARMKRSGE